MTNFYAQQQLLLLHVLGITVLAIGPSVTRVDHSKTVEAKITKFSPLVAWKTLISLTVKLFHKLEEVTQNKGAR